MREALYLEITRLKVEVARLTVMLGRSEARIWELEVSSEDYRREVESCFDIAQRLDAQNPEVPGSFTGTPSERIKRQMGEL